MRRIKQLWILLLASLLLLGPITARSQAADVSLKSVLDSIDRAIAYLKREQQPDGSWDATALQQYKTGVTALVVLALLNGGVEIDDPVVRRGVQYLRDVRGPQNTYDIAMMMMALSATKDPADRVRVGNLATLLERGQLRRGIGAGTWGYTITPNPLDVGDRSNGQLAVLALRDAAESGVPIDRSTWERARQHWLNTQNGDGGWGYAGADASSTGSMTVAGIATLSITGDMLRNTPDTDAAGNPICCVEPPTDEALQRGLEWLEANFSVRHNPRSGNWVLYYLYGLERAGRLTGRRLFGDYDWYREGADYLTSRQSARGFWKGVGHGESDPVVGTSFSLLFLAKGLSPILINKLKFGPRDPRQPRAVLDRDWNQHPDDVRHLTKYISGLPKWPRLVSSQVVDLARLPVNEAVAELQNCPILYVSGSENPNPRLTDGQVAMIRGYLDEGGFVFAVRNCARAAFDDGFTDLVQRLYPDGEATIERLTGDHPVFRAEYPLDWRNVELYGVDVGCRTAIIYAPEDLSCLWEKWAQHSPPSRTPEFKLQITRAMRIGVNVVAYVTGRRPPLRITDDDEMDLTDQPTDSVERGLLQIAKLRHTGGWDTAPRALRNLLVALNRTVGLETSTARRTVLPADPNLFRYPLVYMHGRYPFQFNRQERDQLRAYLTRGGLLFADACCGSKLFDDSFRTLVEELFPDHELKRIPVTHPLFQKADSFGYDIDRVTRQAPATTDVNASLERIEREGEPFLEGVEIDGRLVVIYSKYDISCALEKQASVACSGYVFDDAVKLGINIVLYALAQ